MPALHRPDSLPRTAASQGYFDQDNANARSVAGVLIDQMSCKESSNRMKKVLSAWAENTMVTNESLRIHHRSTVNEERPEQRTANTFPTNAQHLAGTGCARRQRSQDAFKVEFMERDGRDGCGSLLIKNLKLNQGFIHLSRWPLHWLNLLQQGACGQRCTRKRR